MEPPAELLGRLTRPFWDVFSGLIGKITRVHFIVEFGDLNMVRMIGDGTGRQKERCAFIGVNFTEKDIPAIRELFAWMKKAGIEVEVLKVEAPKPER